MYIYIYVCVCEYIYISLYFYISLYKYMYICVNIYLYLFINVFIYIYIYVCVKMYACLYPDIYIYIYVFDMCRTTLKIFGVLATAHRKKDEGIAVACARLIPSVESVEYRPPPRPPLPSGRQVVRWCQLCSRLPMACMGGGSNFAVAHTVPSAWPVVPF
eukprot:NODE_1324_length_999_cov_94.561053_g918_i0.p1 GENE.NODE_1324_length_999_cov_94.561053_g918_i0~~NODE_1324_length_999_cov_94.561053_g918_i0.p1  ORF type:complete len:159 (-),score=29.19 NODE_1324_length_999_cov_94.561053_g918_i0:359-835(-)